MALSAYHLKILVCKLLSEKTFTQNPIFEKLKQFQSANLAPHLRKKRVLLQEPFIQNCENLSTTLIYTPLLVQTDNRETDYKWRPARRDIQKRKNFYCIILIKSFKNSQKKFKLRAATNLEGIANMFFGHYHVDI